ncbi:histone deacetylase family protein [bacterium]|nr:histone deacetylase family protein [bacterium]
MIRFRRLVDVSTVRGRHKLAEVQHLYQRAFPYYQQYATRIATLARQKAGPGYQTLLLIAEGAKGRLLGFTLTLVYLDLKAAYLDYIASEPERPGRGIGAALYEATREILVRKGIRGLYLEVPTDDSGLSPEPEETLALNQRRIEFYERFGVRAIEGTLLETLPTKANRGFLTLLLFDPLESGHPPGRTRFKQVLERIYDSKYGMLPADSEVRKIVRSVRDDPVRLRPALYAKPVKIAIRHDRIRPIELVVVPREHHIHHLHERGYVERPVRVQAVLEGLRQFPLEERPVRHHGLDAVRAVHDPKLIAFLKKGETELPPGRLLYPDFFPVRRPDRLPREWEMQTGYFCIDTFTPLTSTVFQIARNAVDSALTGADLLLAGSTLVYVLCRPPGHHAERAAFGGFCYFNNAAIAAHRLSANGPVALLDIDYHHGNGTQDIFYQRSDVLTVSVHGHPRTSYPYFAGYADEKGEGDGVGYNRNYPIYPGATTAQYLEVLDRALRRVSRFKPEWLVVSLGLDIMGGDPSGQFRVTPQGMRQIGERLGHMGLPTLVVQEGGYSLRNLRQGAAQFFAGLAENLT